MIANSVEKIYQTVLPNQPVSPVSPYYVDLSSARGDEDLASLIARRIRVVGQGNYHCHLVTGHRGSGKSTELMRLRALLEELGFLVAPLDVEVTLTLDDVEYLDVLVGVAQKLQEVAEGHGLEIDQRLVDDIGRWFADTVLVTEEGESVEQRLDASVGIGGEVPLLVRALAAITGQIKSGTASRVEIRQRLERRVDELITRINELVGDVTYRAQEAGFQGLVVIVDSLEKMPLKLSGDDGVSNHNLLFIEHASQLKSLQCHMVYTVPVSLLSNRNLSMAYTDFDMIPMIKVVSADSRPWIRGRKLLREVVARRLDIDHVFDNPRGVYKLIDASGGVIRDLMRLILFAADYTPLDGRISNQACDKAISKVVREYDRLVHLEDLKFLLMVAENPHTATSRDIARLMYNRLVLPYVNQDNWLGLHPAVRLAPTLRTHIPPQEEAL